MPPQQKSFSPPTTRNFSELPHPPPQKKTPASYLLSTVRSIGSTNSENVKLLVSSPEPPLNVHSLTLLVLQFRVSKVVGAGVTDGGVCPPSG